MQYDIDGGNITVVVGEEARMDVPTALNYIKSGQDEIEATVNAGIDAFDLNAANKTTDYNNNASAKVTAYNNNATAKTDDFDLNASGKTNDFNDNYTIKKGLIDASVDAAAGSASAASASADLAQQWAVKMDGKVADEDYSAKYYADLASQSAGATGANKDLSNLTAAGEAKFDAKQDVIDSSHKLSASLVSGLAAVATSGAYSDLSGKPSLATVATSGSYNDLSNKPNLSQYALDNAVVKLTGTQTIAGSKTFSYDPHIKNPTPQLYMDDTAQTKGTAPSADVWGAVTFRDANGNLMGRCRQLYANNKKNVVELQVHKANSSTDTTSATLGVVYPASGNAYGFAPDSDVNGSILTTVNKSKSSNGYFQFGNGLIVQWGHFNKSSGTVSFPKAFTSTNYALAQVQTESGSVHPNVAFNTKTTTGFNILNAGGVNNHDWIAIGY